MMNALKIHVFTAGTGSAQTRPFNDALIDLKASKVIGKNDIIHQKTIQEMFSLGWNDYDIINWCNEADILIVNCHPLQDDNGPDFDYIDFFKKFRSMLTNHKNAFPTVINGAFSQDKFEYYEALQDFMNPSLKIDRPINAANDDFELDKETKLKVFR